MRLRYVALGLVYSLFVLLTRLSNHSPRTHVVPVVHSTENINKKCPAAQPPHIYLEGPKGGTSSFFSVKLLAKSEWNARYCFFCVVWPSLASFIPLCDLLQAEGDARVIESEEFFLKHITLGFFNVF